jgi:hypothetical protein
MADKKLDLSFILNKQNSSSEIEDNPTTENKQEIKQESEKSKKIKLDISALTKKEVTENKIEESPKVDYKATPTTNTNEISTE